MNPRRVGIVIVSICVAAILIYIVVMLLLRVNTANQPEVVVDEFQTVLITKAKSIYQDKKEKGMDFTTGPCLSNDFADGWVLDLVHNPRTPVDDLLENQCSAFLEGKAEHFIELDLAGNLIRLK